jgi:hypothetical protein
MITETDTPVYVLLDDTILNVDTRLGIKKNHPVLGGMHAASKLNLKARLRASDLAAELATHCKADDNLVAKGWHLIRCGR